MDPFLNITLLLQEESQREIGSSSLSSVGPTALPTKADMSHSTKPYLKKEKSICSHCGVPRQVIDKIYKLHGFSFGLKLSKKMKLLIKYFPWISFPCFLQTPWYKYLQHLHLSWCSFWWTYISLSFLFRLSFSFSTKSFDPTCHIVLPLWPCCFWCCPLFTYVVRNSPTSMPMSLTSSHSNDLGKPHDILNYLFYSNLSSDYKVFVLVIFD